MQLSFSKQIVSYYSMFSYALIVWHFPYHFFFDVSPNCTVNPCLNSITKTRWNFVTFAMTCNVRLITSMAVTGSKTITTVFLRKPATVITASSYDCCNVRWWWWRWQYLTTLKVSSASSFILENIKSYQWSNHLSAETLDPHVIYAISNPLWVNKWTHTKLVGLYKLALYWPCRERETICIYIYIGKFRIGAVIQTTIPL